MLKKVGDSPYERFRPSSGSDIKGFIRYLQTKEDFGALTVPQAIVMAIHGLMGHPGVDRTYELATIYGKNTSEFKLTKKDVRMWVFNCKACTIIRPQRWLIKYCHEERAIAPFEIIDTDSTHIAGPWWLIIARDQYSAYFWAIMDWRQVKSKIKHTCPYDRKGVDQGAALIQHIQRTAKKHQSTIAMIRSDQGI